MLVNDQFVTILVTDESDGKFVCLMQVEASEFESTFDSSRAIVWQDSFVLSVDEPIDRCTPSADNKALLCTTTNGEIGSGGVLEQVISFDFSGAPTVRAFNNNITATTTTQAQRQDKVISLIGNTLPLEITSLHKTKDGKIYLKSKNQEILLVE